MPHLIDKDAVVAEIEKLHNSYMCYINNGLISVETFLNKDAVLVNIKNFLDTIEVKEVDFIKEFYTFSEKHKLMDKDIEFSDIEKTASFFFQLGLKAQNSYDRNQSR